MINRINLLLQAKNITAKQFAEEIGIQPSGMSHILGGRNNPSLEFVAKVLRRYPELDANWLLLGRGSMYAVPQGAPAGQCAGTPGGQDEASCPGGGDSHAVAPSPHHAMGLELFREHDADVPEISDEELLPPPAEAVSPAPSVSRSVGTRRRLSKVLLIYNDGTFFECDSREN